MVGRYQAKVLVPTVPWGFTLEAGEGLLSVPQKDWPQVDGTPSCCGWGPEASPPPVLVAGQRALTPVVNLQASGAIAYLLFSAACCYK